MGAKDSNRLKVESRKLDSIAPYEGNPRRIPGAAVDAVAASIERYGFRQPIVVDAEGVVIAGHTRLQAARKLGLETVYRHLQSRDHSQSPHCRVEVVSGQRKR